MLTASSLREILHYDPDTGVFTWRTTRRGHVKEGEVAGCRTEQGYLRIRLWGKAHRSHRLAVLYMEGKFPESEVDHINGRRDDNRWVNLRHATRKENARNRLSTWAKSGVKGVEWHYGRWRAAMRRDGKRIHLGCFDTKEEAAEAYAAAIRGSEA